MKYILLLLLSIGVLFSCDDTPVGYLRTEFASFETDSLMIYKDLDITPPHMEEIDNPKYIKLLGIYTSEELISFGIMPKIEAEINGRDYYRNLNKIPWVSYPIEGIDGTLPIRYNIVSISEINGGDVTEINRVTKVAGDGTIQVDFENNIPVGTYFVDLEIYNEGHSHTLPKILKIIVK